MPVFTVLSTGEHQVAYLPGSENAALTLHREQGRLVGNQSDAFAVLAGHESEIIKQVRGLLGLPHSGQRLAAHFRLAQKALEEAAAFPSVGKLQLWPRERLQDYLAAGGRIPGLQFDAASNQFVREHQRQLFAGESVGEMSTPATPIYLNSPDEL